MFKNSTQPQYCAEGLSLRYVTTLHTIQSFPPLDLFSKPSPNIQLLNIFLKKIIPMKIGKEQKQTHAGMLLFHHTFYKQHFYKQHQ